MGGRCGRLSREMKSSDFHFKRITLAAEWHKKANKGQEQRQKVPMGGLSNSPDEKYYGD